MADEQVTTQETPAPKDWQLRTKIRSEVEVELRAQLRVEYETLLSLWKDTALVEAEKKAEKIALDAVGKLFEKWKEEQKPPSDDDIQRLLNQDYVEFNIQIQASDDEGEIQQEVFVLRELPQAAEKKFYRQFKDKILSKAGMLQAFTQEGMDKSFEDKAKAFLDLFDESFDMLADAVVVCLNPFGKKKVITREWVQHNISSNRQWQIVEAQIKVNRLKDFFSKLSQSGQQTQTMLGGLSFQQLQQLAR